MACVTVCVMKAMIYLVYHFVKYGTWLSFMSLCHGSFGVALCYVPSSEASSGFVLYLMSLLVRSLRYVVSRQRELVGLTPEETAVPTPIPAAAHRSAHPQPLLSRYHPRNAFFFLVF